MKEFYSESSKCTGYEAESYEEFVQLMADLEGMDDAAYPVRSTPDMMIRYIQSILGSIED